MMEGYMLVSYDGKHGRYEINEEIDKVEIFLNCVEDGEPCIWIDFYEDGEIYYPTNFNMIMLNKGIGDFLKALIDKYYDETKVEYIEKDLKMLLKDIMQLLDQDNATWGFPKRRG